MAREAGEQLLPLMIENGTYNFGRGCVCLFSDTRENFLKGAVNQLALLSVEDLVVELYHLKLQKEPSKTWVHQSLDTSMWDYSSSIRYSGFALFLVTPHM